MFLKLFTLNPVSTALRAPIIQILGVTPSLVMSSIPIIASLKRTLQSTLLFLPFPLNYVNQLSEACRNRVQVQGKRDHWATVIVAYGITCKCGNTPCRPDPRPR